MNEKHEQLKQAALDAITALHGDTSVGNLVTRDDLIELRSEIDTMLDAIDADIDRGD